jgi:carotenoid cleavage dioxygenase
MDGEAANANPFLRGNFAPLRSEDDFELAIEGSLPAWLSGTFYRIGPNPQFEPRDRGYHWFGGDGMIHAFALGGSGAPVRYRNRYVRTPKWETEHAAGRSMYGSMGNPMSTDPSVMGTDTGVANTNIMLHAGRLLALEEGHAPFEVTAGSLETVGYRPFGGKVTAHPKVDPATGEMVFIAYADGPMPLSAQVSWGMADAAGELVRRETFVAPYCSMIHDFALTGRYLAIPVMPLTGDLQRAMGGRPPFAWEPEKPALLAIIDRTRGVESLVWAQAPLGYVFHVTNARDEGDEIVIDLMRYPQAPFFPLADGSPGRETGAVSVRWRVDPTRPDPVVAETVLDDLAGEFPRFDERRALTEHRHAWFSGQAARPGDIRGDCLAHLDLATGRRSSWTEAGVGGVGEPVFVPARADAPEGEGVIITLLHRRDADVGELAVFDALDIAAGPRARARLPRRVPFGFHANWVAA